VRQHWHVPRLWKCRYCRILGCPLKTRPKEQQGANQLAPWCCCNDEVVIQAFDQAIVQKCIERTYDVTKTKGMNMDAKRPKLAKEYAPLCTTPEHFSKTGSPG
jgi:hypothetical protein